MKRLAGISILASLLVSSLPLCSPARQKGLFREEAEAAKDERMEWWREARFGMFIHWGLYAIPAGEWNGRNKHAEWIRHTAKIPQDTYDKFVGQFNPVEFDAGQWARMARDAGMKYIVITSKHHDGFCLWPSDQTDYDVESTPFKRDILGELKKACEKEGIRFCTYHSIMDWHHPAYPPRGWEKKQGLRDDGATDMDRYTEYLKAQLEEIIENYHPAVMWFDGEWEGAWTHERGLDLYEYVRGLQPDIIINNRVDKGREGMHGLNKEGGFAGDFGTPEQRIPPEGLPGVDWESCMTMNRHWGWNKSDKNWKSAGGLVERLVDIASKGGNYLLNIGPKPDGTFPQESIERLAAIGDWMDVNAEAIYGTTASPIGQVPFGRVTAKEGDNTLYLHIFDWPEGGSIELPGLASPVASASLLGDSDAELEITRLSPNLLRIALPQSAPSPYVSVVRLKYEGDLEVAPYVPKVQPDPEGVLTLKADAAETKGNLRYEDGKDCLGYWTDNGTAEWLLDVEKGGDYKLSIVWACAEGSGGTPFRIEVGDSLVKGKVPETGGWDVFEEETLGTVQLEEGEQFLRVIPLESPSEGVMNLRRIVLAP